MSYISRIKYLIEELHTLLKQVEEDEIKLNMIIKLDTIEPEVETLVHYLRKLNKKK